MKFDPNFSKPIKICFLQMILLTICNNSQSQKNDFNWLFGYGGGQNDPKFGISYLDFNSNQLLFYPKIPIYLFNTNTVISNNAGELRLYSNGEWVFDQNHTLVSGANNMYNIDDRKGGYPLDWASILLTKPGNSESYVLIYPHDSIFNNPPFGNYFTIGLKSAEFSCDPILGKMNMININQEILSDTIWSSGITACKHANGRDWWLLAGEISPNAGIYKILLDPTGFHVIDKDSYEEFPYRGVSQACFSPNGEWYARYTLISDSKGAYLHLYKFDRCNGKLTLVHEISFPNFGIYGGICFSPNSNLLYLGTSFNLFQLNLNEPEIWRQKILIDSIYEFPSRLYTFSFINNAPDGKIYAATGYENFGLHIINSPDSIGLNCNLDRLGLKIPNFNASIPNFPHFRLGPIDNSVCDTLGIDNIPWCWWRYEIDSNNTLNLNFIDLSAYETKEWFWNFGDGSTSSKRHPSHIFTEAGEYEICLIAKNDYGSDTLCKSIQVKKIDATEDKPKVPNFNIKYNYNLNQLTIDVRAYKSQNLKLQIFNLEGKLILKTILQVGTNGLDLNNFVKGIYFIKVMDTNQFFVIKKIVIY